MSTPKDYTGQKIGMLQVLERKRENKRTYYYCRCDCGNYKWVRSDTLKSKNPSCGCLGRFKPNDIKDKRFGKLVAKYPTDKRDKNTGSIIWMCQCDCGNTVEVAEHNLVNLRVLSCGCLKNANSIKQGKELAEETRFICVDGTNVRNLTAKIAKNNTSGYKGVTWDKNRRKWVAQIVFQGKNYYLGRYDKKEDAAEARRTAEDKLFVNFLEWYNNNKNS